MTVKSLLYLLVFYQKIYVLSRGDNMTDKKSKSQYDIEYAKKKLKRIPLDVTKEKYQEIKIAAENANESVNGYIKKSIEYRMISDKEDTI